MLPQIVVPMRQNTSTGGVRVSTDFIEESRLPRSAALTRA